MAVPGVRAATYDGDTATEERRWIRDHAHLVLTNPDLVHHSLLPLHERWAPFLRRAALRRHRRVPHLPRRLRLPPRRAAAPPAAGVRTLRLPPHLRARLGDRARPRRARLPPASVCRSLPVTEDGSPREAMTFAMWEPGLLGEGDGRRSATSEAADLLADLVSQRVQTVAFAKSRAGVEALATSARRHPR